MTHTVSDGEGTLLSLVERAQPVTVYEISKIYLASPVTNFGTSKGKLYPMVRRLKQLGLLEGEPIAGDKRKTEHLRCTPAGLASLHQWTRRIDPAHMLLDDPLRTRIQSLHVLTPDEQRDWLCEVEVAMRKKLAEVEDYIDTVDVPHSEIMKDHVRATSQARLAWVKRTIARLQDTATQIETE